MHTREEGIKNHRPILYFWLPTQTWFYWKFSTEYSLSFQMSIIKFNPLHVTLSHITELTILKYKMFMLTQTKSRSYHSAMHMCPGNRTFSCSASAETDDFGHPYSCAQHSYMICMPTAIYRLLMPFRDTSKGGGYTEQRNKGLQTLHAAAMTTAV